MQPLADYSIETDNTVLLTFIDGSSKRVPRKRLPELLSGKDLERVQRGLQLRQDFVRRNLGRLIAVAVATGLAVFGVAAGEQDWAQLVHQPHHVTAATTLKTKPTADKTSTISTTPSATASTTAATSSAAQGAATAAPSLTSGGSVGAQAAGSGATGLLPTQPSPQVVPTVTRTVGQTVKQVAQPITQPAKELVNKLLNNVL